MSASRKHHEYVTTQRRHREDQLDSLRVMVSSNQLAAERAQSDDRIRKMKLQREFEMERQAEERLAAFEASQNASATASRMAEQEAALAAELVRRKAEAERQERMIAKVAAESAELRQLRAKIQAAYIDKERADQISMKRVSDALKKEEESRLDAHMESERQAALGRRQQEEAERLAKQREQAAVLETQLQDKENQRKQAYEAYLAERQMVDEIVAKIQAEDDAERMTVMAKRKDTQEYIKGYLVDREARREAARKAVEAEDAALRAFIERKAAQEAAEEERKRAIKKEKDRLFAEQAAALAKRQAQDDEFIALVAELQREEAEAAARDAEKEKVEKRIRQKMDMLSAYEHSQRIRQEKEAAERKEEEAFRQAMLDKFAADEKLEQMNAQKRRLRQAEHKREVERMIEERRKRLEEERQREIAERGQDAAREAARLEIVQQERARLLREHAAALIGHLPRGVLVSEEDLKFLPSEVARQILQDRARREREE